MIRELGARSPHLLEDGSRSREEVLDLLDLAVEFKTARRDGTEVPYLTGRQIAILFEKPSTRTRSAFEVAGREQGAASTYIDSSSSHLGETESIEDTALVLGHYYDGIAFRGFAQSSVETLAAHAGVPVWNALTDLWHPTQALADFMTMREYSEKPLTEISLCFLGDGRNNVARSLLTTGALLGVDVRIAAPPELLPDRETVDNARRAAATSGGSVLTTADVGAAVRGVDYLYTDVWVSMGESDELWDARERSLLPYRVDATLVERTGNAAVRFMHCLPSIHDDSTAMGRRVREKYGLVGAEVSDDVFRSPRSIVFEQGENRLHTIKALMVDSLRDDD